MDAIPAWRQSAAAAFREAVERIDGGQSGLAKLIGKSQGAISKRLAAGELLWAEKGEVLKVEAATGISRYRLRPDIYSREDAPPAPPAGSPSPAGGSSSANALSGVRA